MVNSSGKGIKRYEDILKRILNVEEIHYLKGREWDGCLGVACMLSYLEGVPATPIAMSKHLQISQFNPLLKAAYDRLKINGIFGPRFDARNDEFLKGEAVVSPNPNFLTPQHLSEIAWCHIAGIAGGEIGMVDFETEQVTEQ